jgi:hypothetical protein
MAADFHEIAIEEVQHLALVINVITAIGTVPSLTRPTSLSIRTFFRREWNSRKTKPATGTGARRSGHRPKSKSNDSPLSLDLSPNCLFRRTRKRRTVG